MKRLTTLLFADKQLLTFPNPQKRLGEKRDLRSSWRNRGGARRTFHSRRRASSAGFYKRLHLHVATSSSSCHCRDIIVSGVTAIGTCERAAGEENVGHLPRGCHWFETGARTETAHYLPARRRRTEIIDKRILACIEMQKGYSLTSFVFLRSEYVYDTLCIYAYKRGEDNFLPCFFYISIYIYIYIYIISYIIIFFKYDKFFTFCSGYI